MSHPIPVIYTSLFINLLNKEGFGYYCCIYCTAAPTQPIPQVEQPTNQTQPQQPSASNDQPIELVVTGELDGYSVPDASTATRTDTPLRDIPQSIQVVPQQVIEDQQAIQASEALRNVSGVQRSFPSAGLNDRYNIRGFDQPVNLRDGFRDSNTGLVETANLERIEVLKGPISDRLL
ncbi:MAG: TonB-dependent receptor plug domain-containing protein [Nostoc sp.]|uniref:TonB-dependent receptor plug domain-containing protein n=1 Tax=Nostoc sp. TaxID=1180 RepID=UPI002FFAF311